MTIIPKQDLTDFAVNNYIGKLRKDAKKSIPIFWNKYFGIQSQVSFQNLMKAIKECTHDMKYITYNNKKLLQKKPFI